MQKSEIILTGALLFAVLVAPPATSSVRPGAGFGEWRLSDTVETREASGADGAEPWQAEGSWGQVESRIGRGGPETPALHRVLSTWSDLAATLEPGQAVEMSAAAICLDASDVLPADCRLELRCWRSASYARGPAPADATCVTVVQINAGEPAGTVARTLTTWRVPASPEGDTVSTGMWHVRATVTHAGNVLTSTRSYAWSPLPLTASAASAD